VVRTWSYPFGLSYDTFFFFRLVILSTWKQQCEHLAGGVKLAFIGTNLVNQSGLTFFREKRHLLISIHTVKIDTVHAFVNECVKCKFQMQNAALRTERQRDRHQTHGTDWTDRSSYSFA
jgi:hypothetical protein